MKKQFLFSISVFFLLISTVFSAEEVRADTHELEELTIHVYLHEDGSATISEKRIATLSEGTENYIVIGNLGKSTIQDFIVMENGREYEYVEPWDINASREEKTFKHGIIKEPNHYELAWGIGEYGYHEYDLRYTVTDFIKQVKDSQMVFWQFVNSDMNIPPQNVTVTIETDYPFSETNEKIWAFGFEGEIYFDNGKIIAESSRPLKKQHYVTLLVQLPNNTFHTNDILNQTFDEVKTIAFEGSDYTQSNPLLNVIVTIVVIILLLVPTIFLWKYFSNYAKRRKYKGKYVREVPFNGEFYLAYGPLQQLILSKLNYVLSAFILKWIVEGKITVVPTMTKGLIKNREIAELHLVDDEIDDSLDSETQLFRYFKRAAKNGVIKQQQFRIWASNNYKVMLNWENRLKERSFKQFEKDGYVKRERAKLFGRSYTKNHFTPKMEEFEGNVYMFMNYLKDYSLLNEHEPVNVKLWDELMIWAALLGITEAVYEEFKRLYPAYEQESTFSDVTLRAVLLYSSTMNTAVQSSRTGGGGGSSSIGGGGGSFGGGSGGGTR